MKKLFIWLGVAVFAVLFCALAGQVQALSWEQVNANGFGDGDLATFSQIVWGEYMYVGATKGISMVNVWRSSGGTDWEKVTSDGFGDSNNRYGINLAVFDGDLFAMTVNTVTGAEVWRTRNGTDWTRANSDGFGNSNNDGIWNDLMVFQDNLYAAVYNNSTGIEIWRTADGANWTQVNTDGFGSANNYGSTALYVFNDQLYCGTYSTGGAKIYRTADGTNWTSVITAGFGNALNTSINSLLKFDGRLFAFVIGGSTRSVWSSRDGSTWNQITTVDFSAGNGFSWKPMVANGTLYVATNSHATGADLWRTDDGANWVREMDNGNGDANNGVLIGMTVWGDRMYFGFSNAATGAEMWRSERIGVFDITTTSLGTAYESKDYEQKLNAANGTAADTWSISEGELPDGLSIDGDSGTISGTPKVGGKFTLTVSVDDYSTPTQTVMKEFTLTVINKGHIVTGAGAGATPWVRAFSAYGRESAKPSNLMAFASTFRGGVNVATGDLDGDGVDEIITAPRGNGAPQVRVFNKNGTLQKSFYAYSSNLRCGTDVAAADLDGNGTDEIITTPGYGCGPQVKVFNRNGTAVLTTGFFAYASGLRVGVRVAAGDVNRDGKAEIVTVPERGEAAQVRIFDYAGKAKGTTGFYPYGTLPTGGDVTVADLNGDGKDEIITVPGEGYPAQVRIFNSTGKATLNAGFYAYPRSIKTGFLISAGDLNSDGKAEIVTVPKTANAAQVRTFKSNGQAIFTPGFYAYTAAQKAGADVAAGNF